MSDWLRPLLLMFYAPGRGMAEARDRAPLGAAAALALLAQSAYAVYTLWPVLGAGLVGAGSAWLYGVLINSALSLLYTAVVFVPAVIFVANMFERRRNFGLAVQQEFASTASALFYARAAAVIAAFPLHLVARLSGAEGDVLAQAEQVTMNIARQQGLPAEVAAEAVQPSNLLTSFALLVLLPFLLVWTLLALRHLFRFSWPRTLALFVASMLITFPAYVVLGSLTSWIFASPFLLLLLFFLLRGYVGELVRAQRARAAFRQNLEAATLNPADASSHYNLGLLHLQRKELEEARARFERAVGIDAGETDAHFQLGHIAREQGRLPDAIKHFEQVVVRDEAHAQHEIWREIGATYLAAGQFSDAADALERFLEHRPSDPEALYLKGRALAGMGRGRDAADAMQACIEAVRTSPAYKYRASKRWLNEAQQFLRTRASSGG
ncbi:MAG TPA: tetratricopeptide repeat protein [Pyrinomonadaceae bacterium]|nr:tetratricopeptide repeat protein [Pyrinomonadaceae bacterium]